LITLLKGNLADMTSESTERVEPDTRPLKGVNPLQHRLNPSLSDYIRTAILAVTLFPIRFAGALLCFLLSYLVSRVGLRGSNLSRPLEGWRAFARTLVYWLGRLCLFCCGFHDIKIIGHQSMKDEAPVLVVAPHSSFFDAIMVFASGFPYMVNRVENLSIPLMGACIQFNQTIFVSREGADSRSKAVNMIKERVLSPLPWPQFAVFPEGTCSNRKALMQFKPGAFIPGAPVQPVLIRYHVPQHMDTVTWTWDQPYGALTCIFLSLSQWSLSSELEFLPVYRPSEEEKADPQLYADNVRALMASKLEVPLCPLTFAEAKEKFGKKKSL